VRVLDLVDTLYCEFLLMNDIFHLQAINYLLTTYLRYGIVAIPLLHTDVTFCRPFVITSKEKGVVAELLDTVAKHRFVQKISVLSG